MNLYLVMIAGLMMTQSLIAQEQAFVTTRTLTMELANQLAMSAARHCTQQGYQVAVAVTDRSGKLLAFVRNPLSGTHTIDVAVLKAATAASFQTPTIEMMTGFEGLKQAPGVLLVGGGVPVRIGGHMYGAIGVSGAPAKKRSGDVDHDCAEKGIEAIKEAIEFAQ